MKLEKLKQTRRRGRWFDGIFGRNPVLCCGLALPFAVMVTTSLRSSVSISILLACSLIPTVLLASLVGRFLPSWFSPVVYTLFTMVVVVACVPLILPISPEVADSLGIYVPILSVNTILLTLCARYERPADRPVMALVDAVAYSLGFALAMCLIAFFRELLGAGSLWGVPVPLPFKAEGVQIAFAGFIAVALFSALVRFLRRAALVFSYRRHNPKPE